MFQVSGSFLSVKDEKGGRDQSQLRIPKLGRVSGLPVSVPSGPSYLTVSVSRSIPILRQTISQYIPPKCLPNAQLIALGTMEDKVEGTSTFKDHI